MLRISRYITPNVWRLMYVTLLDNQNIGLAYLMMADISANHKPAARTGKPDKQIAAKLVIIIFNVIAIYALALCLSVCLSQASVLSKGLDG